MEQKKVVKGFNAPLVHANKKRSEQTATPDKYPQGYFKDKPCRECGKVFSPNSPSNLYCSDDCADIALQRRFLKTKYSMSLESYQELFDSQEGKCAICGSSGFKMKVENRQNIVIDHCHTNGHVRGLLCHNCNRGLGLFQESPELLEKAREYVVANEKPLHQQGL
jgi:endogenous inhibitor of DNA gyrase (YacG/DUF329 family)